MTDNNNEAEQDVGFDAQTGTYRVSYEYSTNPPTYTLITTVSAVSGDPPQSLEPLHDTIDTDALNTLFDSNAEGQLLGDGWLMFEYEGFEVTFYSDGTLELRPSEESRIEEPDTPAV